MTITKDRVTIMWKKPVKKKLLSKKSVTRNVVQEVCIVNVPIPSNPSVSVQQTPLGSKKKKNDL